MKNIRKAPSANVTNALHLGERGKLNLVAEGKVRETCSIKNQRGAVTLLVLITVLFFITFLVGTYALIANKAKLQAEIIEQTRKIYETKDTDVELIYNSYN